MGSAIDFSRARAFVIDPHSDPASSPYASSPPSRLCSRKMGSTTLVEGFHRFRKLSKSSISDLAASKSRSQSIDADAHLGNNVYLDAIPADVEPARKLLETYSGIRRKEYDDHVHRMVCSPFPSFLVHFRHPVQRRARFWHT